LDNRYRFRQAESTVDAQKLKSHFSEVYFEGVGVYIDTLFHRFPRMKNEYWFIAEEKETGKFVSAFLLMPWTWEMEGVRLKVAQMAGAATLPEYRRKGLIRELIKRFEQTLAEDEFDLAVINGIWGFYRQFGFCYALPVENHVNLDLDLIPERPVEKAYTFHLAEESDIPILMEQDEAYRANFSFSAFRDEAAWEYLLNDRFHTMFGSEFWLMEHKGNGEKFCFRIPLTSHFGGRGLLVSEISEDIHEEALSDLFAFCKQKAIEDQKLFIRLNLHDDSRGVQKAHALGATAEGQFAWQIRIPDPARFLTKIAPVLEKRIGESDLHGFTGTFRMDFFKSSLDLHWEEGKLREVHPGEGWQDHRLSIHAQLFPILCLGHRSWSELARVWPDIGPSSEKSALFVETLFPVTRSWLYEPA
jgi:GNAT superfamily N-acetyltransferase